MKETPKIVNEYRGLALRTLSAASFLDKDPEKYCTLNQLHAAMGLVTEIQELDTDASKQEEISDCCWFGNLAADSVGANFAAMLHEATNNVRKNLLASNAQARNVQKDKMRLAAIHFLDACKASIFYGRELHKNFNPKGDKLSWRETVLNDIKAIAGAIAYYCVIEKIDIYQTMEKNITKLKIRYPEKFDTEKASNRDVDKELDVFNGQFFTEKPGTVILEPDAIVKGFITNDDSPGEVIPKLKELMQSESVFAVTDEHAEEMNSHPTYCANPAEIVVEDAGVIEVLEESVAIEEIPVDAEIQEKMDEVGAAMEAYKEREKEAEVGNEPAKEVEFNAEALTEAVEDVAEQVKADKKTPGRKKNK